MNMHAQHLKNSRVLAESEVPRAGDYVRWSPSKREEWQLIGQTNTQFVNLPVATIRTRCGQPELQFCTFSK